MSLASATTICGIVNIFPRGSVGAQTYHASHVSIAMEYPGPIKAAVAGCAASVVRLHRIVSRHPKSRSPAFGDLPVHRVHLPLSLIYPAVLIVIVIAASATRPGEAHLHYHNQEVNGVDDESDYCNCVGHDDGSRSVVCVKRGRLSSSRLRYGATGLEYKTFVYRRRCCAPMMALSESDSSEPPLGASMVCRNVADCCPLLAFGKSENCCCITLRASAFVGTRERG